MKILLQVTPTASSAVQASSHSATNGKPRSTSITSDKSVEKQSRDKTAIDITTGDLWIMIVIVFVAGGIGGWYNYRRTKPTTQQSNDRNYLATCLLGGVIAGALIPLFLQTIQSHLLNEPTLGDFTIYTGLCLIAAISSNAFIDTLTKRVLDQINAKAESALQTAKAASTTATTANQTATVAHKAAQSASNDATTAIQKADTASTTAVTAHQTAQSASSDATMALQTAQTNSEIIRPIVRTLSDVRLQALQAEPRVSDAIISQDELSDLILKPTLKFRSVKSVAKESGQPESVVQHTFNQLEKQDEVKLIDDDSKIYLTK